MSQAPTPYFEWKVVLLMDCREFGYVTGFLDKAKQAIDKHFNSRNKQRPFEYCEKQSLSSADYMFVARKIDVMNGTVLDERVLDLIIERKNVNDLQSCLILKSKKYKPLSFFEAQMYKLQQCKIPRKVFLMEGDEDDPREFKDHGSNTKMEHEKRLKRVKTMRLQIAGGEYDGVNLECTRTKHDTVQYLIDQMVDLKKRFNPLQPPTRTMEDLKKSVDEAMMAPTFQEYLRLRCLKGIGDAKAMKTIRDPENSWDKSFISPACTNKKLKSTLDDRATFYVSPSQDKVSIKGNTGHRPSKTRCSGASSATQNSCRQRTPKISRRYDFGVMPSNPPPSTVYRNELGPSSSQIATLLDSTTSAVGRKSKSKNRIIPSPAQLRKIEPKSRKRLASGNAGALSVKRNAVSKLHRAESSKIPANNETSRISLSDISLSQTNANYHPLVTGPQDVHAAGSGLLYSKITPVERKSKTTNGRTMSTVQRHATEQNPRNRSESASTFSAEEYAPQPHRDEISTRPIITHKTLPVIDDDIIIISKGSTNSYNDSFLANEPVKAHFTSASRREAILKATLERIGNSRQEHTSNFELSPLDSNTSREWNRDINAARSPPNKKESWTCRRCTFINENICFLVCQMCDEERP